MGHRKKLLDKPVRKDLTFNELETLLRGFGYKKLEGSGSKVKFFKPKFKVEMFASMIVFPVPPEGPACPQGEVPPEGQFPFPASAHSSIPFPVVIKLKGESLLVKGANKFVTFCPSVFPTILFSIVEWGL